MLLDDGEGRRTFHLKGLLVGHPPLSLQYPIHAAILGVGHSTMMPMGATLGI